MDGGTGTLPRCWTSSVLCDAHPKADKPLVELPDEGQQPRHSSLELFAKGTVAAVSTPPKIVQFLGQTVRNAVTTISHLRRDNPPPRPMSAPKTSFNGALSSHRSFAYASLPLADVKHVKNSLGVKVNDVILCVVSGALRSSLLVSCICGISFCAGLGGARFSQVIGFSVSGADILTVDGRNIANMTRCSTITAATEASRTPFLRSGTISLSSERSVRGPSPSNCSPHALSAITPD